MFLYEMILLQHVFGGTQLTVDPLNKLAGGREQSLSDPDAIWASAEKKKKMQFGIVVVSA